jgi:hypothetical protein
MVSRPVPSDDVCDVFYAQTARIGKAFRDRDCVPYWLSLERENDDWVVFVVVAEESIPLAGEILDAMDGNTLSIRTLIGEFGPIKLEFVPIDTTHELQPTPGRSIGPDSTIDGLSVKGTCTLGGYVYGTTTKRVWGLTCGHIVFPKPGSASLEHPIAVNQPSDEDYDFTMDVYIHAANDQSNHEPGRRHFQQKLDTLKAIERRLGTIIHASWKTVPVAFGSPEIEDFAMIEIRDTRVGMNNIRVTGDTPFFPRVTGAGECKIGDSVAKVGRSTGFTTGHIAKTKAVVYHEDYGEEIMVGPIQDMIVDKEDSGSFVFHKTGKVVGMLVGAVQGTEVVMEGNRSVFMSGIFIDIADVLRWCYRVTGEEVKIVHAVTEL